MIRSSRPVFVVSEATLENYSDLLGHILSGLRAEGCHSCVIVPPGHAEQLVSTLPVEVVEYPYMKTCFLSKYNKNRLVDSVAEFRPSLVHCFSSSKIKITEMISDRLNIPSVYSFFSKPAKKMSLSEISARNCRKVFVSSSSLGEEVAKIYPYIKDRISLFRFGTYVDRKVACFANEQRVPSLVVSHPINRLYEFEPMLNAIRHLGIDGYEFVLAVIGTGREESHLRRLVHSLGLSHNVSVVGEMKPVRKFLSGADIFIQPIFSPDFNADIYEAMGAGLAIACPRVKDELIKEDENAVFFEPGDEYSIYQTLKHLLDRHDLARRIAFNAQNCTAMNCSVSRMISDTMDAYAGAVDEFNKIKA